MTVMDVIRNRRSVRSYDPKPIPDEIMHRVQEALRLAPSACNIQPWKFILVSDPDLRRKLGQASRGQMFIADAPLIVVGCGFPEMAYQYMGGSGSSVDVDVAIALDHLTLVAAEEGLGTCWIGAFDEQEVKRLLGIPQTVKVVALTPVGYPTSPELLGPKRMPKRKPASEVFSHERFA